MISQSLIRCTGMFVPSAASDESDPLNKDNENESDPAGVQSFHHPKEIVFHFLHFLKKNTRHKDATVSH
jgi:hypothetical protein